MSRDSAAVLDDKSFGDWLAARTLETEFFGPWLVAPAALRAEMDRLDDSPHGQDLDRALEISAFLCFAELAWFVDCERALSGLSINDVWRILRESPGDGVEEETGQMLEAVDLFTFAMTGAGPRPAPRRAPVRAPHNVAAWPAVPGVYFIQTTAEKNGPIKIGVAKNVRERLRGIQTSHPWPLRLLAVAPGDATEEARMHVRFAESRMSGEWFHATAELLAFVSQVGVAQ